MIEVMKLYPAARLPERKHDSAGYDLYASMDCYVPPGKRNLVSTGIAVAFPRGYVGRICDRSGNAWRRGLHVFAGVIDSDYRGEWKVLIYNSTDIGRLIKANERIAQVLFYKVEDFPVVQVDSLSKTERGTGGLGSTGD